MDLKKLKPTHSQWRAPLLPAADAHARVRAPPVPSSKTPTALPEGHGSELWWGLYHDALLRGFPDPEKVADASLRARERALAIKADRAKVQLTTHTPAPVETAAVNTAVKTKKAKVVLHDALRCKAKTLEGRQCTFKATCGCFCKKHAPPE